MSADAPRLLLAAGGADWEPRLLPVLALPGSPLLLARRCVDVPDLIAAAAAGQGRAAAVGLALPGLDTDVIARVQQSGVLVVVVAGAGDDIDRARLLGADAVVELAAAAPAELVAEVLSLLAGAADELEHVDDQPVPLAVPARDAPVVAVWGPAGAPGRSTVALGLGAAAAAQGIETLLVDVDVYGGATSQMLAVLDEVSGVLAATRSAATGNLDNTALAELAWRVAPRLRTLTGLPRADRWPALRPAALRQVIGRCRQAARLVVLDCGFCLEQDEELSFDTAAPRRNGATVTSLEEADLVLVVGSADPLGLARLARARHELRDLLPKAQVRLVVNRVRPGLGWSREDVARTLLEAIGEVPFAFLPLDQQAVDSCWTNGSSLVEGAPASPLGRAMAQLADQVASETGLAAGSATSASGRQAGRRRRAAAPAATSRRRGRPGRAHES